MAGPVRLVCLGQVFFSQDNSGTRVRYLFVISSAPFFPTGTSTSSNSTHIHSRLAFWMSPSPGPPRTRSYRVHTAETPIPLEYVMLLNCLAPPWIVFDPKARNLVTRTRRTLPLFLPFALLTQRVSVEHSPQRFLTFCSLPRPFCTSGIGM